MNPRSRWNVLAAPVLALLLCAPALAAEGPVVPAKPGSTSVDVPASADGQLVLSLDDAIRLALSRNLELEVIKLQSATSQFRILEAEGSFDPWATARFNEALDESPAASTFASSESKSRIFNLGISQTLLPGTRWGLSWDNGRAESNSVISTVNPSFSSGLTLSVTQPLLRGFGAGINGTGIAVARAGQEVSSLELEAKIIQTILDVEDVYWLTVAARNALAVSEQSLAVAEDLLRITKIRVDVGTLAPIEIVGSESGVAQREEAIIRSRAALENLEDRLKRLLNMPIERWSEKLVLSDEPPVGEMMVFDGPEQEKAFATALERRIELAQSRLGIETKVLQARYDANQTLPSVDLNGSYGYAGLSGTVRCTPFDENCVPGSVIDDGSYGDALSQVTDGDFKNWAVGVSVTIPIFNRSARARATISRLELERSRATYASLEQQVKLDVRLAGREVVTARKTIDAAEKARILAEKNLEAERKKYENGITTNFQILQIEEELAQARLALVRARTEYARALSGFHRAKGDLLEARGVTLVDEAGETCGAWACCGGDCWVGGLSMPDEKDEAAK